MLSRVADSIYWMNRFIERAENVARFVDVNLHLTLDLPATEAEQWEPLINTTGDRTIFEEHFDAYTGTNVIRFLTFDPDYPNSILGCLHRARENARSVREVISSEVWEQVNRFYLMVRNAAFNDTGVVYAPHEFFTEVKMASHLFAGLADATMSHEEAWHWGQLGRLTERADKTSRILDVKYFILLPDPSYVGTPYDNIQWAALLRSASALEMYRKRWGRIDPARVVEFLILDRYFPRAIRFCVRRAEDSLRALTGSPEGTYRNRPEQLLGRLRAELDFASTDDVFGGGLHEFLDAFQAKLNHVGEAISETFFALEPVDGRKEHPDEALDSFRHEIQSEHQMQTQRI
jgi:uncharacterized alpha-E superfamily protein